jgi:hypothetical protein
VPAMTTTVLVHDSVFLRWIASVPESLFGEIQKVAHPGVL